MPAPPVDLASERLRRLPQHASDVFELAIIRMPGWVVPEGEEPFRPLLGIACSRELDQIGEHLIDPREANAQPLLNAIAKLAVVAGVGHRPASVAVRDPALLAELEAQLAPLGIPVTLAAALPQVDSIAADLARSVQGGSARKGYLDGEGVTLERVRAFADAAAAFHRAALWCHSGRLRPGACRVRCPGARVVLLRRTGRRWTGVRPRVLRIGCRAHGVRQRRRPGRPGVSRPHWSFTFDRLHELPVADGDLWADHSLSVAEKGAYPHFARMVRGLMPERPTAEQLAFAEGLLRALAITTEDELDSGRWQKRVATSDGEREYVLTLPDVLEPPSKRKGMPDRRIMDGMMADLHASIEKQGLTDTAAINKYLQLVGGQVPHAPATTARERAGEKYREALEHEGRYRIKLAREAVAIYPDLADAWVLLAEDMPDLARARELWLHALEAATRDLGAEAFTEHAGHFWGVLETRPYIRVRVGLAHVEWELGHHDAAIDHWREILRLNPRDNTGTRMLLVPRLLLLGRDREASAVLEERADDLAAMLQFSRVLLYFRDHGAGVRSDAALALAQRANRHVHKYLLDDAAPGAERHGGGFSYGDEREAEMVATELWPAYHATPGAREWLRDKRREAKQSRKKSKPQR